MGVKLFLILFPLAILFSISVDGPPVDPYHRVYYITARQHYKGDTCTFTAMRTINEYGYKMAKSGYIKTINHSWVFYFEDCCTCWNEGDSIVR